MALIDEIRAKCSAALIAAKEHGQIAALVNAGRTRIASRLIGIGTVLDALGPAEGSIVLDALFAAKADNRPLYWAWGLLEASNLDVGLPTTQAQLDLMVSANLMTQAQADVLKALAVVPDPASVVEVIAAMEGVTWA